MPRAIHLIAATLTLALPLAAQEKNDLHAPEARPRAAVLAYVPSTTVSGSIGYLSGGPCESVGTTNVRIYRDGLPSSCAAPKSWPGTYFQSGTFHYNTFTLVNDTGTTQCVSMGLTVNTGMVHLMVYTGSFDPANIGANLLADSGSSAYPGSPEGLSVSVAPGQIVVAVLQEPYPGPGSQFTFTYNFLVLGCYDRYFEDDQLRSRLWLNSVNGRWKMDVLSGPLAGPYAGTSPIQNMGGNLVMPYPTAPGLALWGYYIPFSRRANFALRTTGTPTNAYLVDTNSTGLPPEASVVK